MLSVLEEDDEDSPPEDDDWEDDDEDWEEDDAPDVDALEAEVEAAPEAAPDAAPLAAPLAALDAADEAADEAALAADDAAAEAACATFAVIVCCTAVFVGHGIANISLIHLVTVPEAKSAYVNVLDLFLISTTTPGWFEVIGTNTV